MRSMAEPFRETQRSAQLFRSSATHKTKFHTKKFQFTKLKSKIRSKNQEKNYRKLFFKFLQIFKKTKFEKQKINQKEKLILKF